MILGGQVVTAEQLFVNGSPWDHEAVAAKCQALGLIGSRFGVKHEHCIWTIPFSMPRVEISFCLFQVRVDADSNDQRRWGAVRHAPGLCFDPPIVVRTLPPC